MQFVRQLSEKGNKVIAACRSPDAAREQLLQCGSDVMVTRLDVSDDRSVEEWAASLKVAGIGHVDLVINNAGINKQVTFDTVSKSDMLTVFTVNAIGPLLVAQSLKAHGMLGGNKPSLVANITSKVGSMDDNKSGGGYAYRASKSALNIITKSMSIDLAGENIISTLLHPGWVKTDMTLRNGLIDAPTSVAGMLGVLERLTFEELQGTWHDYKNERIPW